MRHWGGWQSVGLTLLMAAVLVIGSTQGWPWASITVALVALAALLFMRVYESMVVDSKHIAFVATMTAVASVGRDAMQGIPGVQPATFLILMSGYSFGPATGAAVGAFTALVSNILLGEGGWTPWQMLAWGLVGFSGGLIRVLVPDFKVWVLAPIGLLWGYVFGWLMNTSILVASVHINLAAYIALGIRSFPDDTFHGLATGGLVLIAGRPVFRMLESFAKRMHFTRVQDE